MDSTHWYTVSLVGLGGLIVFMPLFYIVLWKTRICLSNWGFSIFTQFKKHIYYPAITYSWSLTRYGVLLSVILLLGNIFPVIYGNNKFSIDVNKISQYSAYMCIINLSPLILSARLNPLTSLGLSPDGHRWIHIGFGWILVLQAVIHSIIMFPQKSIAGGISGEIVCSPKTVY